MANLEYENFGSIEELERKKKYFLLKFKSLKKERNELINEKHKEIHHFVKPLFSGAVNAKKEELDKRSLAEMKPLFDKINQINNELIGEEKLFDIEMEKLTTELNELIPLKTKLNRDYYDRDEAWEPPRVMPWLVTGSKYIESAKPIEWL